MSRYYHDQYPDGALEFTDQMWKECLNRLHPDEWWTVLSDGRTYRASGPVDGLPIGQIERLIAGAKIRLALTSETWLQERIELLKAELVRARRHDRLISEVAAEGITWRPRR